MDLYYAFTRILRGCSHVDNFVTKWCIVGYRSGALLYLCNRSIGPLPVKLNNSGAWASYQIRKVAGCACAGNAGNVFPTHRLQRKPLVSDPDMHHGTYVTHVPWCMSGSLTCGGGENVPGIPNACAPAILRIWQEAHRGKPIIAKPQQIPTKRKPCT